MTDTVFKIKADEKEAVQAADAVIKKFRELKQQEAKLNQELAKAQQQARQAALDSKRQPQNTELAKVFKAARERASAIKGEIKQTNQQLQTQRNLLKQNGIETKNLNKTFQQFRKSVGSTNKSLTQGNKQVGQSAKAAAAAMRQLPAQVTDIVVGLQAGQNPMTVLLQQGGQLKDSFGGVGNAVRALGGFVKGLLTPLNLVLTAAAGLGAAFVVGSNQSAELRRQIIASGNAASASVSQVESLISETGKLIGSYGTAREAAEALIGSGEVGAHQLNAAVKGLSATVKLAGGDVQDYVQDWVALNKDPVKALQNLNEKQNFLTRSVYEQVKALAEQGRHVEAVKLATEEYSNVLQNRMAQNVESLGYLQRAWRGVKNIASETLNAMLAVGRESDGRIKTELDKQVETLEARIRRAKYAGGRHARSGADLAEDKAELARLIKERDANQALAAAKAEDIKKTKERLRIEKDLESFIKSNRVGKAALDGTIKEIDDRFKRLTANIPKTSKEYIDALKTRNAKIAELRENFAKQGRKRGGRKGQINPLTAALKIDQDELQAIRQSLTNVVRIAKDELQFAQGQYQAAYKDGLLNLEQYYDTRLLVIEQASSKALAAERRYLEALKAARSKAQNQRIKTPADQERQRSRIADIDRRIATTNAKIADIDRERAQSVARIGGERARELAALDQTLAKLDLENKLTAGTAAAADQAAAVRAEYEALLQKVAGDSDKTAVIQRRIQLDLDQAALTRAEREFNAVLQRMRTAEESLNIQRNAGLVGEQEMRRQIILLHQQTAQELEQIVPLMQQAAEAIGPDAVARIAELNNQVDQLRLAADAVAVRINEGIQESIADGIKAITDSESSFGDALRNVLLSAVNNIRNVLAESLAQTIYESVFGSNRNGGVGGAVSGALGVDNKGTRANPMIVQNVSQGGALENPEQALLDDFFKKVQEGFGGVSDVMQNVFSSLSKFVSGLFSGGGAGGSSGFGSIASIALSSIFHDGGIAGQPAQQRKVSGFVFKDAPRYHAGGLAGLAPNEVPAILERGEEVLTRNDPRHRYNNQGSGQQAAAGQPITIINTLDKNEVQNAAFGSGSDQKIINVINSNRSAVRAALGVGS